MKVSRYRSRASEDTGVTFPLLECWNPMTRYASIAAQFNSRRVLCRISIDVLKSRFRTSEKEPMRGVVENRPAIEAAARKLIEKSAFEEDGSVIIRSQDL